MRQQQKLLVLFLVLILAACSSDKNEPIVLELTVKPQALVFGSKDQSQRDIVVTTNVSQWSVTCEADWLSVTQDVGVIVVKTKSDNLANVDRIAQITVSAEGVTPEQVKVTQSSSELFASLTPTELYYPQEGGEQYVTLTTNFSPDGGWMGELTGKTQKIFSNSVEPSELDGDWLWFDFDTDDVQFESGVYTIKITVEAYPNTSYDSREVTITSSDFIENMGVDVELYVFQEGVEYPEFIWNRPTAHYMNLHHGEVKSVDYHDYIAREVDIANLEFDPQGILQSYTHIKNNLDFIPITLTYDAKGRVSTVHGGGVEDYTVTFSYGNHGQYISIEEFMIELSNAHHFSGHVWMPQLMQDITKIELIDHFAPTSPYNNLTLTYVVTADKKTGAASIEFPGNEVMQGYHKFTFENGFVKSVTSEMPYVGEVVSVYTIDTKSGAILSNVQTDSWDVIKLLFNNDRINSYKAVESPYMPSNYTYNENLDTLSKDGVTYSYEYDTQGNWIKRTASDGSEPITRNFIYY